MKPKSSAPVAAEPLTIVLAEDDEDLRSLLAMVLRRDGYQVLEIGDGAALADAVTRLAERKGAGAGGFLVVSDLRLPGIDALQLLRSLSARGQLPPFILVSAYLDARVRAEAGLLGAIAVFDKPFDFDVLRATIRSIRQQP